MRRKQKHPYVCQRQERRSRYWCQPSAGPTLATPSWCIPDPLHTCTQVLWELEQDDEIVRVWWPAEVLPTTNNDPSARTIRYEEGEGFAPEEITVRFRDAHVLVDADNNELDWRYEGCASPGTRAEEARHAAAELSAQMAEAGMDAAQQAAMAERLREFVQRLTGDASKLATDGEVSAQHVLEAARDMLSKQGMQNEGLKRLVEGGGVEEGRGDEAEGGE